MRAQKPTLSLLLSFALVAALMGSALLLEGCSGCSNGSSAGEASEQADSSESGKVQGGAKKEDDKKPDEKPAAESEAQTVETEPYDTEASQVKGAVWVRSRVSATYDDAMVGEQNTQSFTYERDERGNQLASVHEDIRESFELDKNGNATKTITTYDDGSTLETTAEFDVDELGRTVSSTTSDGVTVQYEYGDDSRITKVTSKVPTPTLDESGEETGTTTAVFAVEYDAQGFPVRETRDWGNGDVATIEYSYQAGDNGLPASAEATKTSELGTTVTHYSFSYDENGNLVHYELKSDERSEAVDIEYAQVEEPSENVRAESTLRAIDAP